MTPLCWPCPQPGGDTAPELALVRDRGRDRRLLILPALFDEANKLRRFTVEVMRRLDGAGIDVFLPDLPGSNESKVALSSVSLQGWRHAAGEAALHFGATHLLAIRGGGLVAPPGLPGWHYAPVQGASVLRQLLRARILAAREAGREERSETLLEEGLATGLNLSGYSLSSGMIAMLREAVPAEPSPLVVIEQDLLGGGPLWLRTEPDEDRSQADALAAVIAVGIKG